MRLIKLEFFRLQERYGYGFWRLNDSKKRTEDTFSVYKLLIKVILMHLEVTLKEPEIDSYF